jgi:hypothetical protein
MRRTFRPWKIAQTQLLPPAVPDNVAANHLLHFVVGLAGEGLDLAKNIGIWRHHLKPPERG